MNRSLKSAFSWLRSIFIFDPLIYMYTIVLAIVSLTVSLFERNGRLQHRIARLWSWLILRTSLCPLEVVGLENIDTSRSHLYAANHISAFDIPTLYVGLPTQFRILAKQELFSYPFLGWHLRRSGQVPINQQSPGSAIRSMKRSVETLREGMPLVIFPEGGRSDNGEIKPFQPGTFYLALKAGVDIVPMAIVGTYEVLKMNTFHIRPGRIRLLIGKPIPVSEFNPRDIAGLSAHVQQVIEDMYYRESVVPDPRKSPAADAAAPQ